MLEVDSWGSYISSHQNTLRFKWKKFNQASINVFMQNSSDFKTHLKCFWSNVPIINCIYDLKTVGTVLHLLEKQMIQLLSKSLFLTFQPRPIPCPYGVKEYQLSSLREDLLKGPKLSETQLQKIRSDRMFSKGLNFVTS